ncbi:phospholipase A2 family protein [Tasmannia lanceolata]|uniref:phospholipase A2 family protein n=1 Tax=Tasmannia lanceolata TaxID=3420 RepID=UPI004062FDF8
MNFGFLNNLHQFRLSFRFHSNVDLEPETGSKSLSPVTKSPKDILSAIKLWGRSLRLIFPWEINANDKIHLSSVNTELQRYARSYRAVEAGCSLPLFRPYVAKVPWHKGARAFLSQFFPRYGHYCGPNWSSGKDNGSMLWDQRPLDWLDFCCYCHDIGYDTHDQAKLLKADLAFLECLEKPRMDTKGDPHIAFLYRSMCITGLRNVLIPYRRHLLRLQARQSFVEWLRNLNGKSRTSNRHDGIDSVI